MRAHVIYSPIHQISLDSTSILTKSCDEFGIEYELVPNVAAPNAPGIMSELNLQCNFRKQRDNRGAMGCFLSHYGLWKRCLEDNIPYIICEHDAQFIRRIPDNLDFVDTLDLNYNRQVIELPDLNKPDVIMNTPNNGSNCMSGTDSYIIKPHAAKILIDNAHNKGWRPSDIHINADSVKLMHIEPIATIQSRAIELETSLISTDKLWNNK